jgi:hypothetical protein
VCSVNIFIARQNCFQCCLSAALLNYFHLILKKEFSSASQSRSPLLGSLSVSLSLSLQKHCKQEIVLYICNDLMNTEYSGQRNDYSLDLNSPFLLLPSKITLVLGQPDHTVDSQETCGQPKPTALFHTSPCQFNSFLSLTHGSDVLLCN